MYTKTDWDIHIKLTEPRNMGEVYNMLMISLDKGDPEQIIYSVEIL
jgi:hypothetical protein